MNKRIKTNIFIKIAAFIILEWISNFDNYKCIFIKFANENCNYDGKLYTRNYRLLAKYKQDNDSNNVLLKERFPNNEVKKQTNISHNEKVTRGKSNQSNKSLLNKAQYYTEIIDNSSVIFDGKHFHFEKKWIKKKHYDSFLEKRRRICDIYLGKIKFKSYGFVIVLFFIFFLVGIGIPILHGVGLLQTIGTWMTKLPVVENCWKFLEHIFESISLTQEHLYILSFGVLLIILTITLIIGVLKILKNNEKYKKLKLMTEQNE
ncbi:Plasmodium exported protein (Pm-fam-a like), unknown function [Plasmodium malariae]|uniref:Fam-m protein n=1 Tax=Plasmodium malariae TaxID=5858 RepID=A0A1A8X8R6_PLAMA|nr:Plasmodium exported protein (Pm-fam-a like), unknown function [Plasmodium malariae]